MSRELLASQKNNSGILLDPRTKLAVLITIAVFILSYCNTVWLSIVFKLNLSKKSKKKHSRSKIYIDFTQF